MLVNQRVIWKDNTTLKDMSLELNNLSSGNYTVALNSAQDNIYIGSDLPFNHRHFIVNSANAVSSVVSVEIWDGSAWVDAVDVLDQTSVDGATLAQSGIISWATERTSGWSKEETTEDISDLSTLKIYDMYWVKLTFTASFTSTTSLSYIGHKFATDDDLGIYGYPELNSASMKAAYETGKLTWEEQHVAAAEQVVRYLRKKAVIQSRNQIFDWEQFNEAATHKLAELIYFSFGDDYEERRKAAENKYYAAMNLGIFQVDRNITGRLEPEEKVRNYGLVRR
jgi:hypothetical protein